MVFGGFWNTLCLVSKINSQKNDILYFIIKKQLFGPQEISKFSTRTL